MNDPNPSAEFFQAHDASTGEALEPRFGASSAADVERAATAALRAFETYGNLGGAAKGHFLRLIAAQLEAATPALVARAQLETALPAGRLQGEAARTCNQLRLFAEVIERGSWVDARIDRAVHRPQPPHKPDLRSLLRPIGPVAVFGASNFPLAFSVAGGDTASALAAGNPVIAKAHPAHPGTSQLAAEAITSAAEECSLDPGVFSLLFDPGIEIGRALVRHPAVRAVGFTGSLRAGRALMDLAASRPEPIPVFAEMGSLNPVFILPRALAERELAAGLHASVTLGAGQFCTKPGLLLLPAGAEADRMLAQLGSLIEASPAYTLLTPAIAGAFRAGSESRGQIARTLARASHSIGAVLFETTAGEFLAHPQLSDELFGPATLAVRHGGKDDLLALARALGGHLTATVHATPDDLVEYRELLDILPRQVGRVVFNGYPTGVEVSHAMVHGGPYPAACGGETSVGSRAILRFVRPVCFQDAPEMALPPELHDTNPLGIFRRLDGKITRDPVRRVYRRPRALPATS